MIVATAEECLKESTVEYVIYEKTKINTPLGKIIIIEVTKEGTVLVAGPSTNKQMMKVISLVKKYNVKRIFVDGALFRKSIANSYLSDGIIVATGASYSPDINQVVEDTAQIIDQLSISITKYTEIHNENSNEKVMFYNVNNNEKIIINESIVHNEDILSNYLLDNQVLYIAGALTNRIFNVLVKNRANFKSLEIIVQDPTYILLEPKNIFKLNKMGIKLSVLNQIDILFVTFNPYSPSGYEFENELFRQKLKQNIKYELINVVTDLE
jgi:hypothetical protein